MGEDARITRSKAAVVEATVQLVVERGVAATTVDAIAERSGVAKTTIYRHWSSKAEVVIDAIGTLLHIPPSPDTGSLREDLCALTGAVLVTGASGNVGRAVVSALVAQGIPVRAADRRRSGIPAASGEVATVALDFTDATTFAPALRGVHAVFLLRPPAIARVGPTLNAFVEAAVRAGIAHVVFLSVAGAETNRVVPHHRVETHLRSSGVGWTILRPGFFAQNIGDAYAADIQHDDRLYVPAGRGRVAFVDVRDLGEVAAHVFSDPAAHAGHGYLLTGPQAVTFDDVAAILSRHLGRTVRYEPATIAGYLAHLRRRGLPLAQVAVQTILHVGLRRGDAEVVDPTLERLLGRPPRTVDAYVADHLDRWRNRFNHDDLKR